MNVSMSVLEFLVRADTPDRMLLVPNAPPVSTTPEGLEVALSQVLSADDVQDTLATLRSKAPGAGITLPGSGTFSFGMPNLGRFRVSFVTQRGSRIVLVERIPYDVPSLADLLEEPGTADEALELLCRGAGGLLVVSGASAAANTRLVYALLKAANEKKRQIIYILERRLGYLMGHGNSVIVQTELGADCSTFEEGLQNAMLIHPGILYLGEACGNETLPALAALMAGGTTVIVSSATVRGRPLLDRLQALSLPETQRRRDAGRTLVVEVSQAAGEKVHISFPAADEA